MHGSAPSGLFFVRLVSQQTLFMSLFGSETCSWNGDDVQGTATALNNPNGIWGNTQGIYYIADSVNHLIRV